MARIWRKAYGPMMDTDDQKNHGWNQEVEIDCISEVYPNDLVELLVTKDDDVMGGGSDQLSLGSSDQDEEKRMHPEKNIPIQTYLSRYFLAHLSIRSCPLRFWPATPKAPNFHFSVKA